jgi:hypothetical protein
MREYVSYHRRKLDPKVGWHGITYLGENLGAIAAEEIVVGKGLQSGSLTHSQAAVLCRIWMNEIVTVLRNVGGHGRGW